MTAPSPWTERLAQSALALGVLYALYRLGGVVAPVLSPVVFSFVLAYFLDPVIDRITAASWRGRRLSRSVAIVGVATLALTVIGLALALVLPALVGEVIRALEAFPEWASTQWDIARAWLEPRLGIDLEAELDDRVASLADKAQDLLVQLGQMTLDWTTTLFNLVLVPIFTFYFLRDFDDLKVRPLELIPPRYHDAIRSRARAMDREVGNWVRGQFQVALCMAVGYGVGLAAIGLKMGFVLGFVAGLIGVVPYLGFAMGSIAAVLMALIYGGDDTLFQLIGLTVVFSVVQMLESYWLTPRLVGEKMGMSPLTVMVVLLLGGSLFGFYGLLLSVPVVAALGVLGREAMEIWRRSPAYTGATRAGEPAEPAPVPSTETIAPPAADIDGRDPAEAEPSNAPRGAATARALAARVSPAARDEDADPALDTDDETTLDGVPTATATASTAPEASPTPPDAAASTPAREDGPATPTTPDSR